MTFPLALNNDRRGAAFICGRQRRHRLLHAVMVFIVWMLALQEFDVAN